MSKKSMFDVDWKELSICVIIVVIIMTAIFYYADIQLGEITVSNGNIYKMIILLGIGILIGKIGK